ncbi:G_PROTEIN_RECEP_F1_2 domain-containing protein, partial [Meloidogyne graminicola]
LLILFSFLKLIKSNNNNNNKTTTTKFNLNKNEEIKKEKEEHKYILFARNIYSWLVPSMITILLMAVIGNGLIVISSKWLSIEASHYNWLCISLAGSDCWAAILLIIGLLINSYMPIVLKIYLKKGKCLAAFLEIFRISGMLTSNLHILALASNQFLGICYPLLYKTTITTERIKTIILFIWLIPIGFVGTWFISIPGDNLFSFGCKYEFYTHLPFPLNKFRKNKKLFKRKLKSKLKLLTTTLIILSTFTLSWVCKIGCPFIYLESISFETGFLINSTVNFMVAFKLIINPLIYALRMGHIKRSISILFLRTLNSSQPLSSQLFTASTAYATISRQLSPPRPLSAAADLQNENNNSLLLLSAAQKHFQKKCSKCCEENKNIKNNSEKSSSKKHLLAKIDDVNINKNNRYLIYSTTISNSFQKLKNKNFVNWKNFVNPSFEEIQSFKGIINDKEKINSKNKRRMTR